MNIIMFSWGLLFVENGLRNRRCLEKIVVEKMFGCQPYAPRDHTLACTPNAMTVEATIMLRCARCAGWRGRAAKYGEEHTSKFPHCLLLLNLRFFFFHKKVFFKS